MTVVIIGSFLAGRSRSFLDRDAIFGEFQIEHVVTLGIWCSESLATPAENGDDVVCIDDGHHDDLCGRGVFARNGAIVVDQWR